MRKRTYTFSEYKELQELNKIDRILGEIKKNKKMYSKLDSKPIAYTSLLFSISAKAKTNLEYIFLFLFISPINLSILFSSCNSLYSLNV